MEKSSKLLDIIHFFGFHIAAHLAKLIKNDRYWKKGE
jgi:hypothetical protein